MDLDIAALAGSALLFLGTLINVFVSRRNRNADAKKSEADAKKSEADAGSAFTGIIQNLTAQVSRLQEENQKNYETIATLRNAKEKLEGRLEDKDAQLRTVTTQLEKYQSQEQQNRRFRELIEELDEHIKLAEEYRIVIQDQRRAINTLKAKTGPLPELGRDKDKE